MCTLALLPDLRMAYECPACDLKCVMLGMSAELLAVTALQPWLDMPWRAFTHMYASI